MYALINMELETLFSNVILRFSFNLLVAFVIIKLIYHRDYKGNDFVFTYFMFNTLIFFFAYILGNLDINMAFGFGLFAVFAILRYRTDPIPIKEMTYLFIVITTCCNNDKKISHFFNWDGVCSVTQYCKNCKKTKSKCHIDI